MTINREHRNYSTNLFYFLPLIFLGATLVELIFNVHFSRLQVTAINFITAIILLDVTHNAFTIGMLWIPQIRSALGAQFYLMTFSVFAISFSIFLFVFKVLSVGVENPQAYYPYVGAIWAIIASHHNISQQRGISFLITRWTQPSPAEANSQVKIRPLERAETWLSIILLLSFGGYLGLGRLKMNISQDTASPLFDACFFLVIASLLGWLFVMYLYDKGTRTHKTLFGLRLILYPLSLFTVMGPAGIAATHGIEYLYIFKKLIQKSNIGPSKTRFYQITIFAILTVAAIGTLRVPLFLTFLGVDLDPTSATRIAFYKDSLLLNFLLAASISITFAHYYMDRKLFQMRNPRIRHSIGQILGSRNLPPGEIR